MPGDVRRVALYGEFGIQNLGNEGTLTAALDQLRAQAPEWLPSVVCVEPERVVAEHGVRAVAMHAPGSVGGRVGRAWRRFAAPLWCARVLRGQDALVVTGTGLLEDSGGIRVWQAPWSLLAAVLGARARRIPVAFLAVGVSPATSRAKRLVFATALRLAGWRSYRDEVSRSGAAALGVVAHDDAVHPDLCFGFDAPQAPRPRRRPSTIGLGVMAYSGDDPDPAERAAARRRYVDAMVGVGVALLERGHRVRILIGEATDVAVAATVAEYVRERAGADADVTVSTTPDLASLMAEMAGLDAAVVTRYHNVVAGLRVGLPVVAVAYAAKTRALLADHGLEALTVPVDRIEAADVVMLVESTLDLPRDPLRALVQAHPAELEAQMKDLVEHIRGVGR